MITAIPSCKIPGCSKASEARGLCKSHYQQWWRRRRQEDNAPCGVPGCPDPSLFKGYCKRHYARLQKHGDLGPPERLRSPNGGKPLCKVDGCDNPHNSHGYCNFHSRKYILDLRGEQCMLEGCEQPLHASGYCSMHYARVRKHGDPGPANRLVAQKGGKPPCMVKGCDSPRDAYGYCTKHYMRKSRGHGDAEYALDRRCRCVLCEQYRSEHPEEWARAQHVWHERHRRRRRSLKQFSPERKAAVTRRLRAGCADSATISAAAAAAGITVTRLWAYVDLIPEWGRKVNAILMETRDPDLKHGTEWAYKRGRCRCPECRESNRLRSQRERATNAGEAGRGGRRSS